jgi:hypothetical protein
MKKVMFLIVGMLLSANASAATLSLTTAGTLNASQEVSAVVNNGPVAIGSGETTGGSWWSDFNLTTDEDTSAVVEWSFNPESAVSQAELSIWDDGVRIIQEFVAGDFITSVFLQAGHTYWVDFTSVTSTALSYDISVSAVPVPAALFLFAPALLGFFGLRRKAAVAA